MTLLLGKTALIFGVANDHSIAWGIARAMHGHGAKIALSYAGEALERRVRPLADTIQCDFVEQCDVSSDEEIETLFIKATAELKSIDILVHSIAFANREDMLGRYIETRRDGFHLAMDVSVYSLTALARKALPLMKPGSSILTITYYAGQKAVPKYNVMGIAKAALEASVRYLAMDLGSDGIRVNAISAGPIRTLAAAGVPGFKKMYREFTKITPLKESITIDDVGAAAVWLASDMASKTTGEVLFVDSGYNILGLTVPEDLQ
ncbi:MAG: enoyl-ACP reductase [Chloroflexi bacterium RBG_16_48_8]|nr:MAG: enoyl-ACP reductase [Chloroflexi bacterium RBG_16_48_8]